MNSRKISITQDPATLAHHSSSYLFLETKSSSEEIYQNKQNKRENQTNVKQQAQVVIESF